MPEVNYRHMPIRGLYELRRMVDELKDKLPKVRCPVRLLQGNEDPVVVPESISLIYKLLGSEEKDMDMIPSKRHGILYEDVGDTHRLIIDFVGRLENRISAENS